MNVEELLTSKNIKFAYSGKDLVVACLNPEHDDRNPSMRIDKIMGIFNCPACGFKGNIFKLYNQSVDQLQSLKDRLQRNIRVKAAESIGITLPPDIVPYEGTWRGIKPETYKKFGAFQHHASEHIGRIVFPITNITGKIVALNGRHTTGGTPKYLFSPPGVRLPLFPIVKPIKGTVILVEGIYDVINLHDKGLTNAICCFGTKNINENKLSMLRIQGIDYIYIFFDPDDAGQNGAIEVKNLCEKLSIPSSNILVKSSDPGDLTEEQVLKLKGKLYD